MRFPTVVVRTEMLLSWLTVSDYSRSRLAQELDISKGRVSQLLTSNEEPSAHLIAKLMVLTRLPFERLFKVVYSPANSFPSPADSSVSSREKVNENEKVLVAKKGKELL